MNFTLIFTGIVAVAKAVPVVKNLIDKFVYFYLDQRVEQAKKVLDESNAKRVEVIDKLKEAKTNEERRNLSKLLADIERM